MKSGRCITVGRLAVVVAVAWVMVESAAIGATLGEALNATNLTWTTSGFGSTSGWTVESTNTHDGILAAASDFPHSSSATSTLQTTVTGPGTLSFWWSSPAFENIVRFSVNGSNVTFLNAYSPWIQQTVYLGSGTQTVKWVYSILQFPGDPFQYAYLDQVNYVQGATAPVVITQPLSQSQVPNVAATFTVEAGGTPPLTYQWQFNGTDIGGATATSYTVTNLQSTNLGYYTVIVSNSTGSIVSSNAMLEFGEVTAWGYSAPAATSVATGATNIVKAAPGDFWGLAMRRDGSLLSWGARANGGLTNPPAAASNALTIAAGNSYAAALSADGSVTTWGSNYFVVTNLPVGLSNVVAIAASYSYCLALTSGGSVVAWGEGVLGETNVPSSATNAVAIAASGHNSLALRSDGTVVQWGSGPSTPADLTNVVAIAVGDGHGLALLADGTVRAWGDNSSGQVNVPAGLSNVVAITAGGFHNLVLLADGTPLSWGSEANGLSSVPAGLSNVISIASGEWEDIAVIGNGPPVVRASVSDVSFWGSGFSLKVPSQSGRVYQLQYKNSAEDTTWTSLPLVAGSGKTITLTDGTAGNSKQRIYRVLRW